MNLLKTILGCASEEDMIGSKIIGVCEGDFIRAVGSQGLYIPLCRRDNSSRILSENELCELLGCFNVVRFNKDDKVIASYEVPRRKTRYYIY